MREYKFLLLFPPPSSSSSEYRTRFIVQINSKPANRESTNHLFKFLLLTKRNLFFSTSCDDEGTHVDIRRHPGKKYEWRESSMKKVFFPSAVCR